MLIEMSAGELKYRVEITELLLQRGGVITVEHHLRNFMRAVLTNIPNTVRDFRITLPQGTVKFTSEWHVNEYDCNRLAAQWLDWIEEDLK